jgi:hypothetical protein
MSLAALLLAVAGAQAAPPGWAGETACWFENGVVVVSAEVMGVAGDYILDTAAPQTLLAATQAQGAGFAQTALIGGVRLAGRRIDGLAIAVQDLDVRTGLFPTPIAGVIGADALKAYVVDVRFEPCRVALRRGGQVPGFGPATALPLSWIGGVPTIQASASDGLRVLSGAYALATGSDTAVRLSAQAAQAPGAAKPRELYPYGVLRPRLRALSLGGAIAENLPAGLIEVQDPALSGEIGAPLLWAWRVRFDFPAGRLLLAPKAGGPRSHASPSGGDARSEGSPSRNATRSAP